MAPAPEEGVRVDVQDSGPGISPADRGHLREVPAGQRYAHRKAAGTGLGLPISRKIVEHFGGRLWVESDLGQGATFSFVLPLDAGAPAEDVAPARAPERKELGR